MRVNQLIPFWNSSVEYPFFFFQVRRESFHTNSSFPLHKTENHLEVKPPDMFVREFPDWVSSCSKAQDNCEQYNSMGRVPDSHLLLLLTWLPPNHGLYLLKLQAKINRFSLKLLLARSLTIATRRVTKVHLPKYTLEWRWWGPHQPGSS